MSEAQPFTPAISTSCVGPLGIMHLPRFWLKLLLAAQGRLPADYRVMTATFDKILIDALELDPSAVEEFVRTALPDYLTFERWIQGHGKALAPGERAALNEKYQTFKMGAPNASARRAELGLTDESIDTGALLNDLDDWSALHRSLTS